MSKRPEFWKLRDSFVKYLKGLDFQEDEIKRAYKQAQKENETFNLHTIEVLTRDILQENSTNSKLIFKERCELMGLLTQIKQKATNQEVINLIFKYFNAKYSLFEQAKKELPYHYRVITPTLYSKISQIPEDIICLEDGIEFLIDFYYKHQKLTDAQQAQKMAVMDDVKQSALEIIEGDTEFVNNKRKTNRS